MTPSRARRRLVSATLLATLAWAAGGGAADAVGPATASLSPTAGVGIDPTDTSAVLAAWGDIYASQYPPAMGFTGNVAGCQPGTTSAAYRAAQLKVINGFRKLVGVNPVVENASWTPLAQAAAVTMAANKRLSHTIDASWLCYSDAAARGAASSNLALGYEGPRAMVAYVADPGVSNAKAGHRRWLFCPTLGGVGLGNAPGSNAMTIMGSGAVPGSGTARDGYVSWPNRGVLPVSLAQPLGLLDRYSVQVGTDESVAGATVSITSSEATSRGPVNVSELTGSDELYCAPAVIWRANRAPSAGESWTFTVAGVRNKNTGATRTISWTTEMSDVLPDTSFVKASYVDFLGRQPTAAETQTQSTAVWTGTTTRTAYLYGLANSPEWVAVLVRRMYLDTLGREPDPAGLTTWVDWIRSGRFTVAQAASLFYSSQEFYRGAGQSDLSVWVTQLYAKLLGRAPDPLGLQFWVQRSADPAHGLSGVAGEFYQSLESRLTRVQNLYAVLLGRQPDAGGWTFWADYIATAGDLSLAVGLAASLEYELRAQARF